VPCGRAARRVRIESISVLRGDAAGPWSCLGICALEGKLRLGGQQADYLTILLPYNPRQSPKRTTLANSWMLETNSDPGSSPVVAGYPRGI
jgi:hypothetical protein